jgi:uncharacterized protein YjbI with pentapeptide repeats
VFPWLVHTALAGAILGTALAGAILGTALAGASAWLGAVGGAHWFILGALGAFCGALVGILVAMTWAVDVGAAREEARESVDELWDRWLDAHEPEPEIAGSAAVAEEPSGEMILERARVRPRVVSPISGEAFPLDEEIWPHIKSQEHGAIHIYGPAGSGKTIALRHVASLLPATARVSVLDDPDWNDIDQGCRAGLVVYASRTTAYPKHLATYRLASWTSDEFIEYLLSAGRKRCASVMARLGRERAEWSFLGGNPELWTIVLDRMLANDSIAGLRQALRAEFASRVGEGEIPEHRHPRHGGSLGPRSSSAVQSACLTGLLARADSVVHEDLIEACCFDERLIFLVRHKPVQLLLAAEWIEGRLSGDGDCSFLLEPLSRDLVHEAGLLLRARPSAIDRLKRFTACTDRRRHPMAASLLHAAGIGWRPEPSSVPRLEGAYLAGARWPGVALVGAAMRDVDLRDADLTGACLQCAEIRGGNFSGAVLRGSWLDDVEAGCADFRNADLSRIHAERARFRAANLEGAKLEHAWLWHAQFGNSHLVNARFEASELGAADLTGAKIEGADFSGANLNKALLCGVDLRAAHFEGARLTRAVLRDCNLEAMKLPHAEFANADLTGSYLTGSSMPSANFERASLRDTGLAEVDWEGARLARADLRGASFHMGSSRSGLVGSPIACEGSRTGFYTDDYDEQDFKSPEEIRKANLCGADLRGAKIDGVDFYLVDLRGALFDRAQHRICGSPERFSSRAPELAASATSLKTRGRLT